MGQLYKQALLAIDDRGNAGRFDEVSSVYAAADAVREAAVALGEELYAPLDGDALRASLVVVDQAVRKLAPLVAPAVDQSVPPPPGLEQRWRALYSHARRGRQAHKKLVAPTYLDGRLERFIVGKAR